MSATTTKSAVLFEKGSIKLEKTTDIRPEIVKLLSQTLWGTPGGTRLQHLDTKELITQLPGGHFIGCYRNNRLNGVLSLYLRSTTLKGNKMPAFYLHHVAFQESIQAKTKRTKQTTFPLLSNPKSWLKQSVLEVFKNPGLVHDQLNQGEKTILYAFIESENERSLRLVSGLGFQTVRNFRTLTFSRLNPKPNPNVFQIQESEKEDLVSKLEVLHGRHQLFFKENLFRNDHYYVFRKAGEIIAGVQATPVNWSISELPGLSGKITLNLLPHIPLLSKLFNPTNFNPLVFDAVYFKEGCEKEVNQLLEAVLSKLNRNTALLWLDEGSPIYSYFKKKVKLGLLDKLQEEPKAQIVARFINFSEEEVEEFKNQPVYISALDLV